MGSKDREGHVETVGYDPPRQSEQTATPAARSQNLKIKPDILLDQRGMHRAGRHRAGLSESTVTASHESAAPDPPGMADLRAAQSNHHVKINDKYSAIGAETTR